MRCDLDDRKSVGGHVFTLGGGAICWTIKKQPTVARSSTEADYLEATEAAAEALGLRHLFMELGWPLDAPVEIFTDLTGAIALAKNPVQGYRTKHIDTHVHFVRHHVANKLVRFSYMPTAKQPANYLTKELSAPKVAAANAALGLQPRSLP